MNQFQEFLNSALAFLKKHAFWVEVGVCVAFAIGTALWVGRDAYKQAAELSAQGQALEARRKSADVWLSTLQPATNAESQDWFRIESALQQLGASPDSRLTLLEVVTRRAERAGLNNVHVSFTPTDSVPPIPREGAAPVTIKVADYAILVDFRGSFAATRAFLASLPATVGVQRVTITRSGQTVGTRAVLTVYEAVVNGPS
jgi:hypothetical protein